MFSYHYCLLAALLPCFVLHPDVDTANTARQKNEHASRKPLQCQVSRYIHETYDIGGALWSQRFSVRLDGVTRATLSVPRYCS